QLRLSLGTGLLAILAVLATPPSLRAEAAEAPNDAQPAAAAESVRVDPGQVAREALEIEARNEALRLLQEDLRGELEELKQLREQLASEGGATAGPRPDLGRLVKFYQAMKPKTAATLLEALPLKLAADVLASMSPRSAGKILNSIGSERAVQISERMAGRR
ncbi:MAG: MotE family protein, partial [Myxococcota bacterium]